MSRYKQPYSLFKRGKYWYFRTYTIDGVRTTAKTTGKTSKGAAKEYCDKLYLSGDLTNSSVRLKEYSEHFFDDDSPYCMDRSRPIALNTKRLHRTHLRCNILPALGNVKISDLNYSQLKKFRIELLKDFSSNTVIGIMGTLQTILNYAYKDRLISTNPFDFLEPIHKELNVIDAFELKEIKELCRIIDDEMFERMIILMALTGMRISEAIGIEPEDIKKLNGVYYIELKRQYNRSKYTELKGKWTRSFPVIPEVLDLIGFQKGRMAQFYRIFEPLKNKYETPERKRLCFHSLRHFFITNTIAAGIPESKVNYFTGHRQKGINQVYINFKVGDLLEFLEWQKKVYNFIKK